MDERINVTKTYLPDMQNYTALLREIWKSGWITNNGRFVQELEKKLSDKFRSKYLLAVTNGTVALEIAIKALDLSGTVITTPFSFASTTSSIVWMGCTPTFVDINPNTYNIDASKIEEAITKDTTAILVTHVFGNPCDVQKIKEIAKTHNLKVIYDAAHCFGVEYNNKSIFNYGDISILSMHATKIFHTVEGGLIVCKNKKVFDKASYIRKIGHKGEEDFYGIGTNGKMSEVHAIMGLAILPNINNIIKERNALIVAYKKELKPVESKIKYQKIMPGTKYNGAYFPVVFKSEKKMLDVKDTLNKADVYPRRYFYPSLNTLPYVKYQKMPIAEDVSKKILCLPLYSMLKRSQVERICGIIKDKLM